MIDKPPTDAELKAQLAEAHDFDPRDPLFGLRRDELSGPRLSRRATLRLLAAGGALTAASLAPGGLTKALAQGKTGGTLNCAWAGVAEIVTLDPGQMTQVLQFQITSNVLSGLTHIKPDLIAEGDLAESWEISEDGLVYTFKLRENATFHNGDAFTADDVLYTFERSSDPSKSIHSANLANVASLEKLSDYEVKFTLKAPQASFLTKTTERASGRVLSIVSKRALEEMGDAAYGLAPVGTGPFKIASHVLGQGVVLEKHAGYFDPERPKLDKVVIQPVDGVEPLAAAVEAGDIHLVGGNPIAAQLIDRFKSNPDLITDIKPGPGFQSVWLNPWVEPMRVESFDKPLEELKKEPGFMVRLALAKALDRDLFVKQARFGYGLPAYGSVNAAMAYYYDDAIAQTSEQAYDPDGAKELLAAAGYPNGEGFPEISLHVRSSHKRDGLVVANILKQVLGITVKVEVMEFTVQLERFQAMDFQMTLTGSGGDYDPDDALEDWMTTTCKFNGRTRDKETMPFGYFSDPKVDELSAKQSVTPDPEARKGLVMEANKITSDKVTCGFLYHPVDVLVRASTVDYPAESRIPGLVDLDRVTLG
ncbi:ABC transporter substrate-binding protein [Albimonas pacifica]|uniref:Peptide/nickel transport system substrate-binding protein/oligopeptide transport system substrate-binding protein n=1 Tax=Albimonas pacifica TaxID=1114924 RepID=A0A1I3DEP2_9RHOB|nr:ABC transporter substrate-binding protein [Albimonas pacifica]SFH85123.1 peptide/nickel transport system substrate-binding protein/oligopeptide transport system substrate-binding protein [Albimonas pacifica]